MEPRRRNGYNKAAKSGNSPLPVSTERIKIVLTRSFLSFLTKETTCLRNTPARKCTDNLRKIIKPPELTRCGCDFRAHAKSVQSELGSSIYNRMALPLPLIPMLSILWCCFASKASPEFHVCRPCVVQGSFSVPHSFYSPPRRRSIVCADASFVCVRVGSSDGRNRLSSDCTCISCASGRHVDPFRLL